MVRLHEEISYIGRVIVSAPLDVNPCTFLGNPPFPSKTEILFYIVLGCSICGIGNLCPIGFPYSIIKKLKQFPTVHR